MPLRRYSRWNYRSPFTSSLYNFDNANNPTSSLRIFLDRRCYWADQSARQYAMWRLQIQACSSQSNGKRSNHCGALIRSWKPCSYICSYSQTRSIVRSFSSQKLQQSGTSSISRNIISPLSVLVYFPLLHNPLFLKVPSSFQPDLRFQNQHHAPATLHSCYCSLCLPSSSAIPQI